VYLVVYAHRPIVIISLQTVVFILYSALQLQVCLIKSVVSCQLIDHLH